MKRLINVFVGLLVLLLFVVTLINSYQLQLVNTQALQVIEEERRQRILDTPASYWVDYVKIEPVVAKVGQTLWFKSHVIANGTHQLNYVDDLYCPEPGYRQVYSRPDAANIKDSAGEVSVTEWEYSAALGKPPFIPDRAMTCRLEAYGCFLVEGVRKCVEVDLVFDIAD